MVWMTSLVVPRLAVPAEVGEPAIAERALSVDGLRGLIIITMVFVNDIGRSAGLPWWLGHFKEDGNGMTFVDVVFPAFLFIVGMSIPLAIENRRRRGDSWRKIIAHVFLRSASLLIIGVLMVESPDDARIGWRDGLWSILLFVAVLLAFHSTRLKKPVLHYVSMGLRVIGFALLAYLAFRYRNHAGGHLEPSWWGILGLIGWTYLIASAAYLLLRQEGQAALVAMVGVLLAVYYADHAGAFHHLERWHFFAFGHKLAPFSLIGFGDQWGSHPSIATCGVVIGTMLLPSPTGTPQRTPASKIRFAGVFVILLTLAGVLLYPTFGINKNNATPTWCLFSAAITAGLWILFYSVVDVAKLRTWALPLAAAGANAFMIYILSELWASAGPLLEPLDRFRWYLAYEQLSIAYPQVILHGFLTAAGLTLVAIALARFGLKLRL
jgi:heparan-alpha-glucosaminide N-acetyltransferase